jgi:hypothetical protein
MIPPAFLEVIQNISKRVFDQFKRYRSKKDKFDIPTNESLEKPTQEMSQSKQIKARVV